MLVDQGDSTICALIEHLSGKAFVAPAHIAVRYRGHAVSYRELTDSIEGYEAALHGAGVGVGAAFCAAVINCLPELAGRRLPCSVAEDVAEITAWLGRDMVRVHRPALRAVG